MAGEKHFRLHAAAVRLAFLAALLLALLAARGRAYAAGNGNSADMMEDGSAVYMTEDTKATTSTYWRTVGFIIEKAPTRGYPAYKKSKCLMISEGSKVSSPPNSQGEITVTFTWSASAVRKAFKAAGITAETLKASGIMPRTMSLQGHNDYVFISRRSRPFIGASAAYYIRKYIAHYNEKEQRAALEEHREVKLLKPFGMHAFRRYFISAPQQSCGLLIGVKNFERYVRVAGLAKLHQQFPKLMKFIEDNGISVNDIRGEDADVKKPYVHRRHKKQVFRPHLPVALFYMFIGDKKLVFSAEPAGKGDKAFIYGPVFPVLLYDLFYRGIQLVCGLHFEQPV